MRTQKYAYMFKVMKIIMGINIMILAGNVVDVQSLWAQELPERKWTLWLGAGSWSEPVYSGSNVLSIMPMPYIQAEYRTNFVDIFAGIKDGIGLRLKAPEYSDMSLAVAIDPFGTKRGPHLKQMQDFILNDADTIKKFLEGTPTVTSPIDVLGTVGVDLPFGKVSSTVTFFPITADYKDASRLDQDYNGLTVRLDFEAGFPLTPQLFLQGKLGTTWMNNDYAVAFHGVAYPTTVLNSFHAHSGMNDVHASVTGVSFFTAHLGAFVYGSVTRLLGDAADSPLTKQAFQPGIATFIFYKF
jgi:MipA family protein